MELLLSEYTDFSPFAESVWTLFPATHRTVIFINRSFGRHTVVETQFEDFQHELNQQSFITCSYLALLSSRRKAAYETLSKQCSMHYFPIDAVVEFTWRLGNPRRAVQCPARVKTSATGPVLNRLCGNQAAPLVIVNSLQITSHLRLPARGRAPSKPPARPAS